VPSIHKKRLAGGSESQARAYLRRTESRPWYPGAQLIKAGDWLGRGASRICANVRNVSCGHLALRNRQSGDVCNEIDAGVIPVEKIEESEPLLSARHV
jgi:hypothetical protein